MAAVYLGDTTIKLQSMKAVQGATKERCDRGGACGMGLWRRFGRRIDRQKIREKIRRGLKRPINDAITLNNQPKTRGRDGGGTRKDARPAESAGGILCDRVGDDQGWMI